MKKMLTVVLVAIVAVVAAGYIAVTFRKSPEIVDGNPSENVQAMAEITETTKKNIIDGIFGNDEETTTEVPTTEKIKAEKIEDYAYAYAGFMPCYADMEVEDWRLILVNRDYILPDGYVPELAPCITDDPDSLKLDSRVAPYYNEMYLAAKADGIELTPVSGYRSVERQTNNFERKIQKYIDEGYSKTEATQMAATIILPPGTSEHNAGLAMDICSLYESFENTKEFKWLNENAADYGFILRYPEDKQDITKIIYEPWHWRYVGVDAAKEMKASGQCLEEYLGVE